MPKAQSIYDLFVGQDKKEDSKLASLLKIPKKDGPENMPHIQVPQENAIHQADLLYLPTDPDGSKFCLVVVDLATGKTDAEPLKNRDSITVTNAMKKIYKRKILLPPEIIEVDDGSEFKGTFPDEMAKLKVLHVRTKKAGRSRQQASVEGKNYVLGRLLQRQMLAEEMLTGEQSTEWVDDLRRAITLMNEKMVHKPKQVDGPPRCAGDSCDLFEEGEKVRVILDKPRDYINGTRLHGNFRAGDIRWDPTIRTIEQLIIKPDQPPLYMVSGIKNAAYTKNQLQKVNEKESIAPPKYQKKFIVSKILSKSKVKGKVVFKVKWKDGDETQEPRTKLIAEVPELIEQFEKSLIKK